MPLPSSIPQAWFAVCDKVEHFDELGEFLLPIINETRAGYKLPRTKRGYRVAMWELIKPEPAVKLVGATAEGIDVPTARKRKLIRYTAEGHIEALNADIEYLHEWVKDSSQVIGGQPEGVQVVYHLMVVLGRLGGEISVARA
jgi:hypothetical protein